MKKALLKCVDVFFLLRIPLLVPVWTILLLGWVTGRAASSPLLELFSGGGSGQCDGLLLLVTAGFSLIVASIYVVNQIVDIESDRINHKLFLLPHGLVSVGEAWALAAVCAAAGLWLGWRAGECFLVIFLVSLIMGVLYNLPPARMKDRPLGGVVANCLGHGTLTFLVGWCATRSGSALSLQSIVPGLIASIAPTMANGAVYLATTIPDAQGDRATGKQTFCVRFGARATGVAAMLLCAAALAGSFTLEYHRWVMVIPSSISLLLFGWLALTSRKEVAYQAFRWPVVILSISVFIMVPWYGVALLVTFAVTRVYYRARFGISYPTFKSK